MKWSLIIHQARAKWQDVAHVGAQLGKLYTDLSTCFTKLFVSQCVCGFSA